MDYKNQGLGRKHRGPCDAGKDSEGPRTEVDRAEETVGTARERRSPVTVTRCSGGAASAPGLCSGCRPLLPPASRLRVGVWGCRSWRAAASQRTFRRVSALDKAKVAGKGLRHKFAHCTDLCWALMVPRPPQEDGPRASLGVSNRVPIPISTVTGLAKCLQKKVL